MKGSFFQVAVVSILLYGCTRWTLNKRMEKKPDGNYTRMLWAILNKSWRQQPTKQQLHSHLPPITKTVQVRWTIHAGHSWKSKDELVSDALLWIPSNERVKAGRPCRTYIQQTWADTDVALKICQKQWTIGRRLKRVRDICAEGATWWWWWWYITQLEDFTKDIQGLSETSQKLPEFFFILIWS